MSSLDDRVAALETRLDRLAARFDELPRPLEPAATQPVAADEIFWALNGLKRRLPEGTGAVLFTGVVPAAVPDERSRTYEWQNGLTTEDLFAEDWSTFASTLTALAHPVRLTLLREVLGGRQSAADLAEVAGLGTTGQLYHHLRQLVGAGWLHTRGRGLYAVPPERTVPLLVVLAAARR